MLAMRGVLDSWDIFLMAAANIYLVFRIIFSLQFGDEGVSTKLWRIKESCFEVGTHVPNTHARTRTHAQRALRIILDSNITVHTYTEHTPSHTHTHTEQAKTMLPP